MLIGGVPLLALSVAQESDILLDRLPQLTGEPSSTDLGHRKILHGTSKNLRDCHGCVSSRVGLQISM